MNGEGLTRGLVVLATLAVLGAGLGLAGCHRPEFAGLAFYQEGGFAGVERRLEITGDGKWTLLERGKDAGSGTLDQATLRDLEQAVAAIDWAGLEAEYRHPTPIPDEILYRIELTGVRRLGGDVSVALDSGAGAPDDVKALAVRLAELIATLKAGQ